MQMVNRGLQGRLLTRFCCSRLMIKWGKQLQKAGRERFQEGAKMGFRAHGHTGAGRLTRPAADQVLALVGMLHDRGGCSLVMSLLRDQQHS